jgi:hypothetical protein
LSGGAAGGAGAASSAAGNFGGAAAVVGMPTDVDARTAFLQGAVPRIVFDSAVKQVPGDADFRVSFLRACDEFRDVLAGVLAAQQAASSASGAEKQGAGAKAGGRGAKGGNGAAHVPLLSEAALAAVSEPAFPQLAGHILTSLVTDFPEDERTWECLAGRPLQGLREAVVARNQVRRIAQRSEARAGKRARVEGAGTSASAADAGERPDDDLFVIDTKGAARDAGQGEGGDDDAAGDDAAAGSRGAVVADDAEPAAAAASQVGAVASMADWAAALSRGAVDCSLLGGTTPIDAPDLQLPLWQAPVWQVEQADGAAGGTSAAAAEAATGRKRKRGADSASSASSAAPSSAAAADPLPVVLRLSPAPDAAAADAELDATDDALQSMVCEREDEALVLIRSALATASRAGMFEAAARLHLQLLALPLPAGSRQARRVVKLLTSLADVCAAGSAFLAAHPTPLHATVAASTLALVPGELNVEVTPEAALALLQLQALLRLGRVQDALAAAAAATAAHGKVAAPVWLLHARLSETLRRVAKRVPSLRVDAPASAVSAAPATGSTGAPSRKPKGRSAAAAAAAVGAPLAEAPATQLAAVWTAAAAPAAHRRVSDTLQAGIGALPPRLAADLWVELLAHTAAHSGASAAATVLQQGLCAGLAPADAGRLRHTYLDALLAGGEWDEKALGAALGASAPASVHQYALAAVVDATDGAATGDSPLARRVRAMFEAAVSAHGDASVELWLQYLRWERAQAAGGAGRADPTALGRASALYSRAVHTLVGKASPAFVQEAARLG